MPHAPEFTRSTPVLYVHDLDAEIGFYQKLGFHITYQGDDFPGFVSLRSGTIEFGLQVLEAFAPAHVPTVLMWQLEARSLRPVLALATAHGWRTEDLQQYWEEQDAWQVTVFTPNGYGLVIEGPNPNLDDAGGER